MGRGAAVVAGRRVVLAAMLTGVLVLAGCSGNVADEAATPGAGQGSATTSTSQRTADQVAVTVHRSETCGCCGAHEEHLAEVGFLMEQQLHTDMAAVKDRFAIPDGQTSCHTAEVGGYAVEGHVPAAAILDLLDQQPDIDGIALPGMPAGSPGMPGEKTEPFVVNALRDGEVIGEFGRY